MKLILIFLLLPFVGIGQSIYQNTTTKDLVLDTSAYDKSWIYDTTTTRLVYYKNDFTLGWIMAYEVTKRRPHYKRVFFVNYLDVHRKPLKNQYLYFKL